MNVFYPFQFIYNIIIHIISFFTNSITGYFGYFESNSRKISWDDSKNTTHLTYSKDEYDRTMIKRDDFSILPFNQI